MTLLFSLLGGALALVLLILAVRAVRLDSRQLPDDRQPDAVPDLSLSGTDEEAMVERLARAVQIPTITKRDPADLDTDAFAALHEHLASAFPRVHDRLTVERVNEWSALYTWPGTNPEGAPIILMAHIDVVPVGNPGAWTHPPFGGVVADGFVWGRGALDDKASAIGLLEAAEQLVADGFQPERTVHLALGHDEEVGGPNGAQALAGRVMEKGPPPAFVLDEGGAITEGALPGVDRPIAAIGIGEKGYLSVEITAQGESGHASVPPETTSIDVVLEAVQRLRENPLPARLDGVTEQTFRFLAPEMGWLARAAFANRWITGPLLTRLLGRIPITNALTRTTVAPTMLDAGVKDNVVPSTAAAVVNLRLLPQASADGVLASVEAALGDLPVDCRVVQMGDPPAISGTDTPWFDLLHRTIRDVAPEPVIVAPYLVPGTTDSRYYAPHVPHVYRFAPLRLAPDDRERIHGPDERIAIDDYRTMVRFYSAMLRRSAALPAGADAGSS